MPVVRRWFPLLLLAACGTSHHPSEFVLARIPVTCQLQARCGILGQSEVQGCIDSLTAVETQTRKIYDVDAAVAAGRLAFDGAHAADCLSALWALDCGTYLAAIDPAICDAVLAPKQMPGSSCKASSECVGGECKGLVPGCSATCVAYPTACDKAFECPPDQYCSPGNHSCAARNAAGAACDDDQACQPGLFCDRRPADCGGTGSPVCAPLVAQNGWCWADVAGCAVGLGCQTYDPSGKCGLCQPWLDVGAKCSPLPLFTTCPGGRRCDPVALTCPPTQPVAGSACTSDNDCAVPTLWCDPGELVCKTKSGIGQSCTRGSNSCIEGGCEAMSSTCQPFSCG
jgi:hypothetical protein